MTRLTGGPPRPDTRTISLKTGSGRRIFGLLGTVQATLIFTITLIAVPLPAVGREFRLGASGILLVSTAYGLAFSGLLLFGGRLADRRGARDLFVAGLVIFASASAVASVAPDAGVLVAARFAEGAGAALVAPAALSLLRESLPGASEHDRALAAWGGLSVLGATAGILLSGVVTTWVSWRWMFAAPLLVSATALTLTPRWLPAGAPREQPAHTARGPLDLPGAALATAGITLLSFGLVLTGRYGGVTVLAPLGLASLAAFAVAERRRPDPLLPLAFLADRRRLVALTAIGLTAAATTVTFLFLSLYFQQVRDWSPVRTSLAFGPYALTLIVAGRVAGWSVARFGARAVLASGLAAAACGLLWLAGLSPHAGYVTALLPGLVLLPAGAALALAGAAVLVHADVPRHQAGLAGGVMNTAMELGPTVGLALLAAVAAARTAQAASSGASATAATTDGYAWAMGAAGLLLLVTGTAAARHDPEKVSKPRRSP
jgi:MFS family permease